MIIEEDISKTDSDYNYYIFTWPYNQFYFIVLMLLINFYSFILVVLDTNIWYHKTQTIGQDISITVGGEYD